MESIEEIEEIKRGAIDSAIDFDCLLLEGISAILKDLCSVDEDIQDGPMVVRGESLWALSEFTEQTVASIRAKAKQAAEFARSRRAGKAPGAAADGVRPSVNRPRTGAATPLRPAA
jgi:hypothetical protein